MTGPNEIEPGAEFTEMERSRATPLRPAIWMTGVLVWATVIAFLFHVPTWAGIFLCSITGMSFLFYLISYGYLMLYDRETLRRERVRVRGRQKPEPGSLVSASTVFVSDQPLAAIDNAQVTGSLVTRNDA